jgi:hypothetical protein
LKVVEFPLNVGQLVLQSSLDWRTWLNATPSQIQKPTDFAKTKSQVLHLTNECERFDITFTVLTEAALSSRWFPQKSFSLIEPNCIDREMSLSCDDTNLHRVGSLLEVTP